MRRRLRPLVLVSVVLAVTVAGGCGDSEGETTTSGAAVPSDRLQVGVAADIGMDAPGMATLSAMGRSGADLNLLLGDFSYAGPDSERPFCDLVRERIDPATPVEIVSGNHEEDSGGDGLLDRFAACLPDSMNAVGAYGTQYYFDVGDLVRFILISPDLTVDEDHHYYGNDDSGAPTADLTWLNDAIDGAREAGIRWVIVGMHKNCISVGQYYCDIYQQAFSDLIEKRVDLVLSGHDHTYQRSKQVAAPTAGCERVVVDRYKPGCVASAGDRYPKGKGSAFVIVGSGGESLYPIHARDPEAGYFVAAMGKNSPGARFGFARLEITPERLALRFVGTTPGSFEDRFEIVGGG
jgi:Calcineurin-like phosphoesterase